MFLQKRMLLMEKKKNLIRILVPVCIGIVIVGIWIIKNAHKSNGDLVAPKNEADFSLQASAVDLGTLRAYNLPIILDFGSDSCIPCKRMAPVLEKMNEEMQGKAIIKFVDIQKYTDAADGYPIQVIPTQVFINADGTAYVPGDDVEVEFTLYTYKETGEHAFTVHQGALSEKQMRLILADMGVAEE